MFLRFTGNQTHRMYPLLYWLYMPFTMAWGMTFSFFALYLVSAKWSPIFDFFIVSVEIWFALSNEFCETLIHFQFPSYTSAINLDETFLRISCLSKTADLNLDFACWTFLIIISIYFEGVTLKTGNSCFATTEIISVKLSQQRD